MNKIMLAGRVGKNPERQDFKTSSCTKFTLATSKKVKEEYETTWHNIVCWGATGEIVSKYVKKGDYLLVEGEQQNRDYEVDGQKRKFSQVSASHIEFGPKPKDGEKNEEPEFDPSEAIPDFLK